MFEGARAKLKRADHHIRDFEMQFVAFVDSNPYTLAVGNDGKSGQTVVRLNFRKPIPADWALVIGDAIHNLHSALDHLTWEVIGMDCGTQDRYVKFPTGDSRTNFEGSCDGIKTPSQTTKDLFKRLEVFPGGEGNTLYSLHQLDIADKHIMLMPVIRAANVSKYIIRDASGAPAQTWVNTKFVVAGDTGHVNVTDIPPGSYIELDDDTHVTPDVVLGPIAQGRYLPIRSMLRKFNREVLKTINTVESQIS